MGQRYLFLLGISRNTRDFVQNAGNAIPTRTAGRMRSLYTRLGRGARQRNIEVNLSFEEFMEFWFINACFYCGSEIDRQKNYAYCLDRKEANIGYTKDNLVSCCGF